MIHIDIFQSKYSFFSKFAPPLTSSPSFHLFWHAAHLFWSTRKLGTMTLDKQVKGNCSASLCCNRHRSSIRELAPANDKYSIFCKICISTQFHLKEPKRTFEAADNLHGTRLSNKSTWGISSPYFDQIGPNSDTLCIFIGHRLDLFDKELRVWN